MMAIIKQSAILTLSALAGSLIMYVAIGAPREVILRTLIGVLIICPLATAAGQIFWSYVTPAK